MNLHTSFTLIAGSECTTGLSHQQRLLTSFLIENLFIVWLTLTLLLQVLPNLPLHITKRAQRVIDATDVRV